VRGIERVGVGASRRAYCGRRVRPLEATRVRRQKRWVPHHHRTRWTALGDARRCQPSAMTMMGDPPPTPTIRSRPSLMPFGADT
jgi:hypothetical protein